MAAILRLNASLKDLLGSQSEFSVQPGSSVSETLVTLGIKPELIAMVSVNGEMQSKDYIIQEGDMIRLLAVIGGG